MGRLRGIDTSKRRGGENAATDSLNPTIEKVVINTAKKETEKPDQANQPEETNTSQYDVVISTPMGEMNGKVTCTIDKETLSGTIVFMNKENSFSNGSIDAEGNIAFKGDLKTPVGTMSYSITGILQNGTIEAVAKTKMGDLTIRSV